MYKKNFNLIFFHLIAKWCWCLAISYWTNFESIPFSNLKLSVVKFGAVNWIHFLKSSQKKQHMPQYLIGHKIFPQSGAFKKLLFNDIKISFLLIFSMPILNFTGTATKVSYLTMLIKLWRDTCSYLEHGH